MQRFLTRLSYRGSSRQDAARQEVFGHQKFQRSALHNQYRGFQQVHLHVDAKISISILRWSLLVLLAVIWQLKAFINILASVKC